MGFAIVHMQKFNSNSLGGIRSHIEREHKPRTNPDVDDTKSNLNYNIDNLSAKNLVSKINSRLKNIQSKRKIRADAIKLAGFIVTSDNKTMKGLSSDQQQEFFKDSVKFFQDRYGADNIIYAKVHMDEKTPHLHVGVVPVVNKNEKLSAKILFNKVELTNLQTDFAKDVGSKYSLHRGVAGSENKHTNILELKLQTADEKAKEILKSAKSTAEAIARDINLAAVSENELKAINENVRYKKTRLGLSEDKSEKVLPTQNYDRLYNIAYNAIKLSTQVNTLRNDKNRLNCQLQKSDDISKRMVRLNNNLQKELDEFKFIKNMPDYLKKNLLKIFQDTQIRNNYITDTINKKCVIEFMKNKGDVSKTAKVMYPLIQNHGGYLIIGKGNTVRQHIKTCVSAAKGQLKQGKVPTPTPPVKSGESWKHSPTMTDYRKNSVNESKIVPLTLSDEMNSILKDTDWTMLTDFEKREIQFRQVRRI